MKLGIQVDEAFASEVDEELLKRVVETTLAALSAPEDVELGVVVADDETVRGLNRQYRGLDETTDVLSFALGETAGEPFPLPPDVPPQLGEVIISFPQAQRQAQEAGHSEGREISRLLVHGLIHLLGYDHEEAAEAEEMVSQEDAVWRRLFP